MQLDSVDRYTAGIKYLKKIECNQVSHSKRTLLDHLIGTYNLLHGWNAPESVCLAGLFHSVYGTEGFRATLSSIPDRKIIAEIIGQEAEHLAWLFGIRTNQSFWDQFRVLVKQPDAATLTLVNRLTEEAVPCTREEMLQLIDMVIANAMDQAQHIPEYFNDRKVDMLRGLLPFAMPEAVAAFTKMFSKRQVPAAPQVASQAAGKQLV